jgi:hypothetical protein
MTESAKDTAIDTARLLTHYSFDLGGEAVDRLLDRWLRSYPAPWLRSAVIEALYQGRYKAVSVEQILSLWQRRRQPLYHFNHEFERIVCSRFPKLTQGSRVEARSSNSSPAAFAALPHVTTVFASLNRASRHPQAAGSDSLDAEASFSNPDLIQDENGSAQLAIQPYQPDRPDKPDSESDTVAAALIEPQMSNKPAIHQFVPAPTASDFYAKLRAVALGDRPTEAGTASFAFATETSGRSNEEFSG